MASSKSSTSSARPRNASSAASSRAACATLRTDSKPRSWTSASRKTRSCIIGTLCRTSSTPAWKSSSAKAPNAATARRSRRRTFRVSTRPARTSSCRSRKAPGVNAPGMVALNDEGGLVPAWRCLQGGEDAAKDAVGESQTVEVGAVALLGVVVADAAPDVGAVGDGDVQEDEVCLVGVQQLGGVLLQVNVGQEAMAHVEAAKVTVGGRGGPDLADHLLQRDVDVVGEGGILGHEAIEHVAVGPETVLDGIGVDGAVGVDPADSGSAPAGVHSVAEDSLRAVNRLPSGLRDAVASA